MECILCFHRKFFINYLDDRQQILCGYSQISCTLIPCDWFYFQKEFDSLCLFIFIFFRSRSNSASIGFIWWPTMAQINKRYVEMHWQFAFTVPWLYVTNMVYTVEEKLEIISLAKKNSFVRVAEIFNRRHHTRLHKSTVARIFNQLRTRGYLQRKKRTISFETTVQNNETKQQVLELFDESPRLSTRHASYRLEISHVSVWKILKEYKFHPYKMTKHQKLLPGDPALRKEFCESFQRIFRKYPHFHKQILWTDEKPFYMNGCFNRQNFR